jgi:hypothetical protein
MALIATDNPQLAPRNSRPFIISRTCPNVGHYLWQSGAFLGQSGARCGIKATKKPIILPEMRFSAKREKMWDMSDIWGFLAIVHKLRKGVCNNICR